MESLYKARATLSVDSESVLQEKRKLKTRRHGESETGRDSHKKSLPKRATQSTQESAGRVTSFK